MVKCLPIELKFNHISSINILKTSCITKWNICSDNIDYIVPTLDAGVSNTYLSTQWTITYIFLIRDKSVDKIRRLCVAYIKRSLGIFKNLWPARIPALQPNFNVKNRHLTWTCTSFSTHERTWPPFCKRPSKILQKNAYYNDTLIHADDNRLRYLGLEIAFRYINTFGRILQHQSPKNCKNQFSNKYHKTSSFRCYNISYF